MGKLEQMGNMGGLDKLLDQMIKNFKRSKQAQEVSFRTLVPAYSNPDRYTHLIHPYPAKLIPHIPFFFLTNGKLSQPGDTILDPFCGSGTVLLEGQLAGRVSLGAETNPLARLISEVKTTRASIKSIEKENMALKRLVDEGLDAELPDVVNLRHWYYPQIATQLSRILAGIRKIEDHRIQNFYKICFSVCVNKVSLADPRLSVPVRLKPNRLSEGRYHSDLKIEEKVKIRLEHLLTCDVSNVFWNVVQANTARIARTFPKGVKIRQAKVVCEDARDLKVGTRARAGGIGDNSVQMIITSPPYPGAQKYIRASSLSLGWLGICPSAELRTLKHVTIGREEFRKTDTNRLPRTGIKAADELIRQIQAVNPMRAVIVATYLQEMSAAFREMHRVLKPNGYLVLVVGNNSVSGFPFNTQAYLASIGVKCGFSIVLNLIDSIQSRGLMTKRNKTASLITQEHVILFEKC
jgi:DNA modification methylase